MLQVLSAGILGNLGCSRDEDFKCALAETEGMEKLQELAKAGSLAPAAVRKAAGRALADVTTGQLSSCTHRMRLGRIVRHQASSLYLRRGASYASCQFIVWRHEPCDAASQASQVTVHVSVKEHLPAAPCELNSEVLALKISYIL